MFRYLYFVSYARKNRTADPADDLMLRFLANLADEVRQLEPATPELYFLDTQALEAGDPWRLELEAALQSSQRGLAIVSPSFLKSEWCRREVETLRGLGRPVIPVCWIPVPARPDWLSEIQDTSDAFPPSYGREGLRHLLQLQARRDEYIQSLKALAGRLVHTPQPARPVSFTPPPPVATPRRGVLGLAAGFSAAGALGWFGYRKLSSQSAKPNYAVQIYRATPADPVTGALVTMRNILAARSVESRTDSEGVARFQLTSGELLQIAIKVDKAERCQFTVLDAFRGRELPDISKVDLVSLQLKECESAQAPQPELTARTVALDSMALGPGKANWNGDRKFEKFHLPWGTPRAEIISCHEAYLVGFDPKRKLARWVGYRIQPGDARRRPPRYAPDPHIPADVQAPPHIYDNNPYDRGNLVRLADVRGLGDLGQTQAEYLSVIAPQADKLNRFTWLRLEDQATKGAMEGIPTWILAGPAFLPAANAKDLSFAVLDGVGVPTHFWRIAIRMGAGGKLGARSHLIPNSFETAADPDQYRISLSELENAIGLGFFSGLPAAERAALDRA